MLDFLPNLLSNISKDEARQISPLVLAFIGDGVQTLYVRTKLVLTSTLQPNELHKRTTEKVKAVSQAKQIKSLLSVLTEEELAIFKRARNSNVQSSAKNASLADYKQASGYEAVIGYLYLTANHERLNYLLQYAESEEEK
ncbi:MAG: ribonuclease III domain-containing protein [Clostridia bacterium]|nr:ribonuclease III domain-containing protein [Clostridia bacterium]MDY5264322.1 ribonuclease III domain-containing protein [Eubacteriales bacterium]